MGSEAKGVSDEALDLPNSVKIFIPMGEHLNMSLNVAVAGGILMAEAFRQRSINDNIQ